MTTITGRPVFTITSLSVPLALIEVARPHINARLHCTCTATLSVTAVTFTIFAGGRSLEKFWENEIAVTPLQVIAPCVKFIIR